MICIPEYIISILKLIRENTAGNSILIDGGNAAIGNTLCKISKKGIWLFNKINFMEKIVLNTGKTECLDIKKIKTFLSGLPIMRLNHVGVAYFTENIDIEIKSIKSLPENKIYAENSGIIDEKWLFAGDIGNWETPLFEIVLVKGAGHNNNLPHFQIDIDTGLSSKEIKTIADKHLKHKFIDWELTIPDYGTVLGMGTLADINGTKIRLGIGSNLRNTEYHRKKILTLSP